jgi:hypothetical protein
MIKAQQGWERRKRTAPTFQTGDQVWLDGRNIKTFHPAAKLAPKRHGPFPIIRVLSPITYEAPSPGAVEVAPRVSMWLRRDKPSDPLSRDRVSRRQLWGKISPHLTLSTVDKEEEYEVERISGLEAPYYKRFGRGICKLQYLVNVEGLSRCGEPMGGQRRCIRRRCHQRSFTI